MKKSSTKNIVWVLLLSSLLTVSTELHAQVFGFDVGKVTDNAKNVFKDAKDAAKKALEEANKKKAEEEAKRAEKRKEEARSRTTNTSIIELQGTVSPDIKWIMFNITKGSFGEKVTIPATNGSYKYRLSLRDGAGNYTIQIFQNNKIERYTSYSYLSVTQIENTDERDMSFLLPSTMIQSEDAEIVALTKTITQNATSETEAIRAIHDWIAVNVEYDYKSYNQGTYAELAYDAVSILKRKVTVCSGYASLFAAMARAYGVRTKVIHGKGVVRGGLGDHAWNEVEINGVWKMIDVTWDSNLKSSKYFLMDEDKFNQDHLKEQEMTEY